MRVRTAGGRIEVRLHAAGWMARRHRRRAIGPSLVPLLISLGVRKGDARLIESMLHHPSALERLLGERRIARPAMRLRARGA